MNTLVETVVQPAVFQSFDGIIVGVVLALTEDNTAAGLPDLVAEASAFLEPGNADVEHCQIVFFLLASLAVDLQADILGVSAGQ